MINVLIADDERKVIQLIRYLVDWSSFGMEIVGTANDGEHALELITDLHPDVVISDIRMPGLGGIELVAETKRRGYSPYFIIVSGYSEFEYAQKAIQLGVEDYLLKPLKKKDMEAVLGKIREKALAKQQFDEKQAELLNRLEQSRIKDKNHLLTDLLVKHNSAALAMTEETLRREYGFSLTHADACCIIAHFYTCDMENKVAADEYEFIISKFCDHLLERLNPLCRDLLHIVWNNEIICLAALRDASREPLAEELQKLKINLMNYRNMFPSLRVVISVSSPISSVRLIEDGVLEARRTLAKRFRREDQLVLTADSTGSVPRTELISPLFRSELTSKIELLDLDGYREKLKELRVLLQSCPDNPQIFEHTYDVLVDTFLYAMKAHEQFLAEGTLDKSLFQRGYSCLFSYRELQSWFEATTCQLMNTCAEERRAQEEKPIRLAKQYIQEHYAEQVSLEDLSSHVGFHPAYLSTVFKKATGQNFSDYLKEVRIDRAKELLLHTELDVQGIASSVGYADVKYFSRLFRKSTRLTPSEYRKVFG